MRVNGFARQISEEGNEMTVKRKIFCSLILSLVMVMQSQITLDQTSINDQGRR